MEYYEKLHEKYRVALLAEGVDRNKNKSKLARDLFESPSSRRAWIEIAKKQQKSVPPLVALLAEGVDRNLTVAL